MPRSDLVDLNVIVRHKTEKAVLVDHPDSNTDKVWLPLSQVEPEAAYLRIGKEVEITIPRILAEEKGLS